MLSEPSDFSQPFTAPTGGRIPIVVDLIAEESKERALAERLFLAELERIRQDDFRLKENYLNIDLARFYSFTVLIEDEKLVAFSGMQKPGPWHARVARISTRFYVAPEFRFKSSGIRAYKLGHEQSPKYHPGSAYLNPFQVQVARRLALDGVFLTRENPRSRRSLYLMLQHLRTLDPSHPEYEVLEELVNICPQFNNAGNFIGLNSHHSCWQNAIVLPLNRNFNLALPTRPLLGT